MVVEKTTNKLKGQVVDITKYREMLQGLITQGLCQLLEPNVTIQCRQMDIQLVEVSTVGGGRRGSWGWQEGCVGCDGARMWIVEVGE